jgi:hypothetical protein
LYRMNADSAAAGTPSEAMYDLVGETPEAV